MFQRRSIWFLFLLPFIGTQALAQAGDELEKRAAEAYQNELPRDDSGAIAVGYGALPGTFCLHTGFKGDGDAHD